MDPEPIYIILIIILLTILTGFFVLSTESIVESSKNKISDMANEGNKKAQKLLLIIINENKYKACMKFSIVFSLFIIAGLAGLFLTQDLLSAFLKINTNLNSTLFLYLSFFIVIILTTILYFIFGVVLPTKIASINPEHTALKTMNLSNILVTINTPIIALSFIVIKGILRLFGIKEFNEDDKASEDEIMEMVEDGVISDSEKEMIDSVFEFNDISCEEIMTPRKEVFMIDIENPLKDYVDEMLLESYSRMPVYENDIDNIIGILYLKDFLIEARKVGFENVNIRKILREPLFVPARKKLNDLFKELQENKTHLAILIDEYGGFSGIVTNEDLVEEIMGEIDDEFDDEDYIIKKIHDNTYKVQGIVTIKELNDELDLDLDEDSQDYDTLGGLILYLLDRIPDDDEHPEVTLDGIKFKVANIIDRRIDTVIISLPKEEEKEETEE